MTPSLRLTGGDVIIVGAGIAGLATALRLAPRPVTVIAQAPLGLEAATGWAQGGIAAALGDDDTPTLHAQDTLGAGAGLSNDAIALAVANAAPACIGWLSDLGVRFDRAADGGFALGLEAAHRRRRIVHAEGDGTGAAVLGALTRAARATASITLAENMRAVDLMVEDGAVSGLRLESADAVATVCLPASAVVLATGGLGGLYAHTTNPLGAIGSGLALAARAGAVLRDLEFVQFHPTAMAIGRDPMPLATEALRGEGAILVNGRGDRFMADIPGAELAPRDIVARAIFAERVAGQPVFLDARAALGQRFAKRFPAVAALCRDAGLDPSRALIPVQPAAHYHMGGIKVDGRGRASLAGLWACGEAASTGLHGANRLASNSLIEALAFARFIAEDIAGSGVPRAGASGRPTAARPPRSPPARGLPSAALRALMTSCVGVTRDGPGLRRAVSRLVLRRGAAPPPNSDAALVALLVAIAAFSRCESRGAHFRTDHPAPAGAAHHAELTLASALAVLSDGPDKDIAPVPLLGHVA